MPTKNLYLRGLTYYARFASAGTLRRICLHTTDLRTAKARLKALQRQAEQARFGIKDAAVWEAAVLAYSQGVLDTNSLKPATAKRYLVSLGQLGPHFDGKPLPSITTGEIGDYVAARQRAGATNATIRRDLTTLSRVLAFAASKGIVASNAADGYDRKLVRERKATIRAPEDSTVEAAALAVAPVVPQMANLVRFLRANGMRAGEALRATWGDVRGDELTIHETKSGRARTINVQALPAKPKGANATDRVFADMPEDSLTLAGKWSWLRRKCPTLPRFRLHDLRHAYAIGEIRTGRDIYDLSGHMGHSSVKVTEVYLVYRPKRNFRAGDTKAVNAGTQGDTKTVTESTLSD